MILSTAVRPATDEFAPYYAKYIDLVSESDAVTALESQREDMLPFLRHLTEAQGGLRYAPGKWSVRQGLGHVADCERVFAYRALRFARADRTALPGFDESAYVEAARFDDFTLTSLVEDLDLLRRSTIAMFRSFDEPAWLRRGVANDLEVSVRALAYMIAGHARHHVRILKERYLTAA